MDTSGKDPNDLGNKAQGAANKAADTIQGGIRNVKNAANAAADAGSDKVELVRGGVGAGAEKAFDATRDFARQGVDAVTGAVRRAQQAASDAQDSIVSYTRLKPMKALLIAAAAGAVVVTLVRALSSSNRET